MLQIRVAYQTSSRRKDLQGRLRLSASCASWPHNYDRPVASMTARALKGAIFIACACNSLVPCMHADHRDTFQMGTVTKHEKLN